MSELGPDGAGTLRSEDLEDLYENAPCGYLSLDRDGNIVKVNATLCGWIGLTAGQLVGRRFSDLLNIAGRVFYETHFAPLLRMQGFFNEVALDLVTADGQRMAVLANAMERRDADGRPLFTRVTIFQAAERRRYERDLIDAREAARAANDKLAALNATLEARIVAAVAEMRNVEEGLKAEREIAELREQFIAILGHDLRNPVASIDAGTRMLGQAQLTEREAGILQLMRASVSRVLGIIENLMDLARGRLGDGIALHRVGDQLLEPTLIQVIEELRTAWPDRMIDTRIELPTNVSVDHARVGQLLSNLLGNAITHGSPEAPIGVSALVEGNDFVLSVANAGDPIPPGAMEHLFMPFYRGKIDMGQQGLGLGLYIASEIAKAHGGRLSVSSDAVETRFTFRMPIVDPSPPSIAS